MCPKTVGLAIRWAGRTTVRVTSRLHPTIVHNFCEGRGDSMDVGVGAVAPKLKGAALRYRSPSSTHWETLFLGQVTASQAHTLVFRQQRTLCLRHTFFSTQWEGYRGARRFGARDWGIRHDMTCMTVLVSNKVC